MSVKDYLFNAKEVLGKSRYPWVDYARGICIILVCYRHVFEGLSNSGLDIESYPLIQYFNIFFFSFRMPLFFIVSGIFFMASLRAKGMSEYVRNRFSTIFYPLLIWGFLQITLQLLFATYVNADRRPIDYLYLITDPRHIEQFWYLNALFFVCILYVFLHVYAKLKAWHQLIVGIVLFSIAELAFYSQVNIGLLFDIFFFYFFFAIGDLLADFILNTRNYKLLTSRWLFLAILPLFAILQHYFTRLNLVANDDYFVQYHRPLLYILCALVGGAFIVNISFILQKMDVGRLLRVIGYHSLFIYVMHLMVTSLTRIVMTKVFLITNVPVLLITGMLLGIIVPIMFYNVALRNGAWWLFSLKRKSPERVGNTSLYYKTDLISPRESTEYKKDEDKKEEKP
ncbi:MAG TPA: acyltransferase [Flavitalea sp.]|nr:acyltransferase [Flavitalea sp.]